MNGVRPDIDNGDLRHEVDLLYQILMSNTAFYS
jgi:hypothetical protein